jgi:phage-related protein
MPLDARREAGYLLRLLQDGHQLSMPLSRPMPAIAVGCHELRLTAEGTAWRVFYYLDTDVVLVLGVHQKATQRTPKRWLTSCKSRLKLYHRA